MCARMCVRVCAYACTCVDVRGPAMLAILYRDVLCPSRHSRTLDIALPDWVAERIARVVGFTAGLPEILVALSRKSQDVPNLVHGDCDLHWYGVVLLPM